MAGICAFAPKTRVALGPTSAIWSPIQSGHQVGFCPLGVLESPEGGEENSLFIIRHCDQRRLHSRRLLALACPSRGRELQSPPRSLRPTAPSRIASRKSCRFSVSNVTSLSSRGVRSLTLSSISRVTRSTSPFGARLLEPSMGAGRFLDASRLNGCLASHPNAFYDVRRRYRSSLQGQLRGLCAMLGDGQLQRPRRPHGSHRITTAGSRTPAKVIAPPRPSSHALTNTIKT